MAVLVDPPMWPAHGRRWSHLVSDASLAELHAFARSASVPERGFEGDHYDVPEEHYAAIVAAGAIPVSGRELLRRLVDSGLRRQKRRGERVLTSRWIDLSGDRLDTLLSPLEPTAPVCAVHVVGCAGPDVLVLPDDDGLTLPSVPVDGVGRAAVAGARALEVLLRPGPAGPVGGSGSAGSAGSQHAHSRRLGYLRLVPAGGGPGRAELVLRWSLPRGAARPVALSPASWTDGVDAASLMPGELGPLVLRAARLTG